MVSVICCTCQSTSCGRDTDHAYKEAQARDVPGHAGTRLPEGKESMFAVSRTSRSYRKDKSGPGIIAIVWKQLLQTNQSV